jgi:hypothetical protein
MKQIKLLLVVILCSSIFAACKKTKTPEPEPVITGDQLPAITQTGANTFGCVVNGNVWIPQGTDGSLVNSKLTIDNTTTNGMFLLINYRVFNGFKDRIVFYSDSIKGVGTYPVKTNSKALFTYGKYKPDNSASFCEFDNSNYGTFGGNIYNIDGYIKVTRYDIVNKIYSGEFEISFVNNSCELGSPVKITGGRFDYKL